MRGMPKIFISYRRDDSKHAVGRLYAALKQYTDDHKRDIFMDIDSIPRGVDFVEHLDRQVAQCDVMFAIIGPTWLTVTDPKTNLRRLDDPTDFVRIEVAAALRRDIPVVPVCLDTTIVPRASDLPEDLRDLARRNGERLSHESFDADVARLMQGLPRDHVPKENAIPFRAGAFAAPVGADPFACVIERPSGLYGVPKEDSALLEALVAAGEQQRPIYVDDLVKRLRRKTKLKHIDRNWLDLGLNRIQRVLLDYARITRRPLPMVSAAAVDRQSHMPPTSLDAAIRVWITENYEPEDAGSRLAEFESDRARAIARLQTSLWAWKAWDQLRADFGIATALRGKR